MDHAQIYFPSNQPIVGVANRAPAPSAPVVVARTPNTVTVSPEVAVAPAPTVTTNPPEVAQAVTNGNPYNLSAPIGIPNRTPLNTPLGVSPQFTTPTAAWTYDYGNGG